MRTLRHYTELYSIKLTHNYYVSGYSNDFDVIPTQECFQNLKRFGFLFRKMDSGLKVYYPKVIMPENPDHVDLPLINFDSPARFTFYLQLKNPSFQNFTILQETIQAYCLVNQFIIFQISMQKTGSWMKT